MPDPQQPREINASPSRRSQKASDSSQQVKQVRIFTATFESLDKVRKFVKEAAEKCGLTDFSVYATQLAVDEAFSNIIEHAYGGECQEEIECSCLISEIGLTIQLKDCGRPFDPTSVPKPDIEADLEDRDIGGLGLYFIQQLMDEVDFKFSIDSKSGRQCNVLRMVKRKES